MLITAGARRFFVEKTSCGNEATWVGSALCLVGTSHKQTYPVLTTADAHKWGMTVLVENERMAGTQLLGAHIVIVL